MCAGRVYRRVDRDVQ
jgi:hypothetical protein